jgi:cytochrome c-type biogenesis protein CcmH/NrfG
VAYRRAVELNPANAAAHLYLGNLLAKQNDLDNSMVHWQLALAYDPNQDQALTAMADSNNRNEKHAANDALLRNAHERSPDNPAILVAYATHLAVCPDAELRNRSKAIQVAEHLLAVTGRKNVRSLVFLAAVVAEAGDFQRAISLLKEARAANAGGGNNPALAALIHADYRQYINKKTSHLSLSPETAPQTNSQ